MPNTNMQEHSGNEKSAVWSAVDFDGEKQTPEMFCVRFASQERAQQFIAAHGKAMDHNEGVRIQMFDQSLLVPYMMYSNRFGPGCMSHLISDLSGCPSN